MTATNKHRGQWINFKIFPSKLNTKNEIKELEIFFRAFLSCIKYLTLISYHLGGWKENIINKKKSPRENHARVFSSVCQNYTRPFKKFKRNSVSASTSVIRFSCCQSIIFWQNKNCLLFRDFLFWTLSCSCNIKKCDTSKMASQYSPIILSIKQNTNTLKFLEVFISTKTY